MQFKWLLFILIVVPLVHSSSIDLDETHLFACATEQLVISGEIQNTKSVGDSYNLDVISAEGISAFVTPTLKVAPYGKARFNLFLSPVCLSPGGYEFNVIAEGVRGERITTNGKIYIRDCNLMELRVSQQKTEVCNGESAAFSIVVQNLGEEEQNFTISTDLDPRSYALSKEKFLLWPYDEGRAVLTLNIPEDLYVQGMLAFNIYSESTYSCGSNSREVLASIDVKRCDGVKVTALNEVEVQAADSEIWTVFFDNQKTDDVYELKAECPSFVTVPESRIIMEGLESTTLNVLFSPKVEDVGEYECKITAISQKFAKAYTVSTKIKVVQNFGVELTAPEEIQVCKGEDALLNMKLINAGEANKYVLSAPPDVKLSTTEIDAAENSTNDFALQIGGGALELGVNTVEVVVRSPYIAVRGRSRVIVEDCFVSALSVSPRVVEMCAGESAEFVIKNTNRGTKEDSYVLEIGGGEKEINVEFVDLQAFRLGEGKSKEVGVKLNAFEGIDSGSYDLEVVSKGSKTEEKANLNLVILPVEVCHALRLEADGTIKRTGAGIGKSFRVLVFNEGRFTEKVELILREKPTWAHITPTELEILPGKKEEVLIYFAPPLNQELGEYPLLVEARGKYLSRDLELKAQVIAIDTAEEVALDLSETVLPETLEKGVEIPLVVTLRNEGGVEITEATIFFDDFINVVKQEPFSVDAGESKRVELRIEIEETEEEEAVVKMGVYSAEGFAEKEFNIKFIESAFEVEQTGFEVEEEHIIVKLKLSNKGENALRLAPSALQGVNFSETEIAIPAGEGVEIEAVLTEGNETLYFEDELTGKVYKRRIEATHLSGVTGLFTLSLGRALPVVLGIVAGAIALYLIISRRERIIEKFEGKRKEDEEVPREADEMDEEVAVTHEKDEGAMEGGRISESTEEEIEEADAEEITEKIERKVRKKPKAKGKRRR